jgi:mono/diheme cytochrome c family protein
MSGLFSAIQNKIRSSSSRFRYKRAMKTRRKLLLLLSSVLIIGACSKRSETPPELSDRERGRAVFVANCVACHNNDPSKDGPIGPAIKGSPKELIEARVLRSSYPPDYKPKRQTKIMPQFPFLEPDIPYLAAYLAPESAQQSKK